MRLPKRRPTTAATNSDEQQTARRASLHISLRAPQPLSPEPCPQLHHYNPIHNLTSDSIGYSQNNRRTFQEHSKTYGNMAHLSIKNDGSKTAIANSSRQRSSSVKPSMRSSKSQITIVGYDADLDIKLDTAYGTTSEAKAFTWPDHLLAVFCIRRRGRYLSTTPGRSSEPEEDEGHYHSPWVLPVYVLSSQKDESRHFIPKEAKCMIDTGNLQGNIVSKAFVVDVLGYPKSSFQPLTKLEEAGGTGVTGHKLIPQGAIHLTWYYSNSTRVFRDMRFLISEHPMYDLIIGSRSIHQNRILDVPNLMTKLVPDTIPEAEKDLEKLLDNLNDARAEIDPFETDVLAGDLTESSDPARWKVYKDLETKVRIADTKYMGEKERIETWKIQEKEKKSGKKDHKAREAFLKEFNHPVPDPKLD